MKIGCGDVDRALRQDGAEAADALRIHAEECGVCRERILSWIEISAGARALHINWESPSLWPRIEQALASDPRGREFSTRGVFSSRWLAMAAGLAFCLVSAGALFMLLRNSAQPGIRSSTRDTEFSKKILTEQALKEIEGTESAYIQSIDRLSRLVDSQLEKASSPLLINYREKLLVLDSAIEECRSNIKRNRFNAHLRTELLSIYHEKQRTLQDVTKETQNDKQLN